MKLPNIYFVAEAGSGKTICCEYLMKQHGYTQSKFANPVYMIAEKYFDMTKKNRPLLQTIGSDVGRDMIDYDLWVRRFEIDIEIVEEVAKRLNKTIRFVSDDVRFPNEHETLKEMGWHGVYLSVPEEIRIQRLQRRDGTAQIESLNHSSETALNSFKDELIQLDASKSLQEMYDNLNQIIVTITEGEETE